MWGGGGGGGALKGKTSPQEIPYVGSKVDTTVQLLKSCQQLRRLWPTSVLNNVALSKRTRDSREVLRTCGAMPDVAPQY